MSQQPSSITLIEYFNKRVARNMRRRVATNTRSYLRHLGKWLGREALLSDLTLALVDTIKNAKSTAHQRENVYKAVRHVWFRAAESDLAIPVPPRRNVGRRYPFATAQVPPGEVSLFAWFESDYQPNALFGKSKSNDRLYRVTIRNLGRSLCRPPHLSDLTDDRIREHMAMALGRGLSRHTINSERNRLCAMATYAAKKRLIEHFPTIKLMRAPLDTPRCWRVAQLETLLKACKSFAGMTNGVSDAAALYAFHLVAWDSGERTGALLALKWEWLDLKDGWLVVPASARKAWKAATYSLKPSTIESIRQIQSPRRDCIFPWTVWTFYNRYNRLLEASGLPTGPRWKPQCIRRSFASYLEAAGHNATDALQHTSRSITVRNYIDPTIAVKTQASDVLPELKGGDA